MIFFFNEKFALTDVFRNVFISVVLRRCQVCIIIFSNSSLLVNYFVHL